MAPERFSGEVAIDGRRPLAATLVALLWVGCGVVAARTLATEGDAVTDRVILRCFVLGLLAAIRSVHVLLRRDESATPRCSLVLALVLAAIVLAGAQVR